MAPFAIGCDADGGGSGGSAGSGGGSGGDAGTGGGSAGSGGDGGSGGTAGTGGGSAGSGGDGGSGGTAGTGGTGGMGGMGGMGGVGGTGGSTSNLTPGLWTAQASGVNDYELCFYVSQDGTRLTAHSSCNAGTSDSTPQAFGVTITDGAGDCDTTPFGIAYTEDVPITPVGNDGFFTISNFAFNSSSPGQRASFSATIGDDDEAGGSVTTNVNCDISYNARPVP